MLPMYDQILACTYTHTWQQRKTRPASSNSAKLHGGDFNFQLKGCVAYNIGTAVVPATKVLGEFVHA